MYVCICHGVTQAEIENAIENGTDNVMAISDHLGAGSGCGSCQPDLEALICKIRGIQVESGTGVQVFEPASY